VSLFNYKVKNLIQTQMSHKRTLFLCILSEHLEQNTYGKGFTLNCLVFIGLMDFVAEVFFPNGNFMMVGQKIILIVFIYIIVSSNTPSYTNTPAYQVYPTFKLTLHRLIM